MPTSTPSPSPPAPPAPRSFIYVGSQEALAVLTTDATGRLDAERTMSTPGSFKVIGADPSGRYVVISHPEPDTFSIDPNTGALSLVPDSTLPRPSGPTSFRHGELWPDSITFHPGGGVAYVMFSYDTFACGLDVEGLVYAYAFDGASGRLRLLRQHAPALAGRSSYDWPPTMALLPSGGFLYASNQGAIESPSNCDYASDLRGYAVDGGSGALAAIAAGPLDRVGRSAVDDSAFEWVSAAATGRAIYVGASLKRQRVLLTYAVDGTSGGLTRVQELAVPAVGWGARLSPDGRLYALTGGGVRVYETTGDRLAPVGSPFRPLALDPVEIAFSRSGRFAYLLAGSSWDAGSESINSPTLVACSVDPSTGLLTALGSVTLPFRTVRGMALATP